MSRLLLSFLLPLALSLSVPANAESLKTLDEVKAEARMDVDFISNEILQARLAANPDLLLLDIRSESEFAAGHIDGATHMPRGSLEFRMAAKERDPTREIILYCTTGSRAALAYKALIAQGYQNVSAHGGLDNWTEAGLPIVNKLGRFTRAPETEASE